MSLSPQTTQNGSPAPAAPVLETQTPLSPEQSAPAPAVDQADPRTFVGLRIGEIVALLGFAEPGEIAPAVARARKEARPTGEMLCELGIITRDQLTKAVAARTQMTYVDLRSVEIDERAMNTVDAATAARYRAVPIRFIDDETLLVAISEPSNVLAVDDVSLISGLKVRPALTTDEQLQELIARISRNDVALAGAVSKGSFAFGEPEVDEADDDAAAARLLDSILSNALRQRASDIHLDPMESGAVRVRYRVDGATIDSTMVSPTNSHRVLARLKVMAAMDISVKKRPQDGRTTWSADDREVTLRIATLPTIWGESAAIRILDRANVPTLDNLGLDQDALGVLRRALKKPHGAILATGPTGSGKTTTLYAALAELNKPERSIITIEDPVEYPLTGVKQVPVHPKQGVTFGSGLRTLLRSDPDVVMIGEIRDHETAQVGIEAALIGRLVLSTLHTNDAASAVTRLTEMGVERYLVASAVECVIASRLARRLCEECKSPVEVDQRSVSDSGFDLRIDAPFSAFTATGCARCNGTGHRGRIGLFEVMSVSSTIRKMLVERHSAEEIEAVARREGMFTLRESALARVRAGQISLAEAARVTATD